MHTTSKYVHQRNEETSCVLRSRTIYTINKCEPVAYPTFSSTTMRPSNVDVFFFLGGGWGATNKYFSALIRVGKNLGKTSFAQPIG